MSENFSIILLLNFDPNLQFDVLKYEHPIIPFLLFRMDIVYFL
jgi:hypothetical protein